MKRLYKVDYPDGDIEYWMVSKIELVAEVTRLKGLNVNVKWREYYEKRY
jgi:hypothetical protein|tara:strand:+ start:532 stop:678 length:147 start_codon:yes stop_codon:yes gene_type:complete